MATDVHAGSGLSPYAAWIGAAAFIGLASDLLQPIGAIATILCVVSGSFSALTFAASAIPQLKTPMRKASAFAFIGAVVFGIVVALQYLGGDEEKARRGFLAAAVPTVAAVQDQVFSRAPAPEAVVEAPTELNITPAKSPTVVESRPIPPVEPGVYRNGDLAAQVQSAGLMREREWNTYFNVAANVAVTVHNLGDASMSIVLMRNPDVSLVLDNGLTLFPRNYSEVSLPSCSYASTCDPVHYTTIEPGALMTVNFVFRGDLQKNASPVSRANLSGSLLVAQQGGEPRHVQLSIPQFPIRADGPPASSQN